MESRWDVFTTPLVLPGVCRAHRKRCSFIYLFFICLFIFYLFDVGVLVFPMLPLDSAAAHSKKLLVSFEQSLKSPLRFVRMYVCVCARVCPVNTEALWLFEHCPSCGSCSALLLLCSHAPGNGCHSAVSLCHSLTRPPTILLPPPRPPPPLLPPALHLISTLAALPSITIVNLPHSAATFFSRAPAARLSTCVPVRVSARWCV